MLSLIHTSVKIFFIVCYFCVFSMGVLSAQNESSMSANADKYFDDGDFLSAQDLYKKLLDINPNSILYNAKYGVCILNTDSNKANCIKYLYFAATQQEVSSMAVFYLARAFHVNYKFDDAITYYQKFKLLIAIKELEKYGVNELIEQCKYGKEFFKKPTDTDILSKKSVTKEFFTSAFDLMLSEAKIYSLPNDFKSDVDIAQKHNATMCLYNQETEAMYSSYGKTTKNGKDLCRRAKFKNEWSKAKPLDELNTPFDEDYPFMLADGNLMYFASKGYNSMGGYDIFKSVWNQQTKSWGKPENLGFPINSPFDDVLFIPIKEAESAYFASDRSSPFGKMEIFKISYPKEFGLLVIIRGKFQTLSSAGTNKAQITVIDVYADKLEGIYNTNEKNGTYILALTPARKYKFIIRTKGYSEHSYIMDVPLPESKFVLKQLIRAEKSLQVETVISYNFFTEVEAEIVSDKVMDALSETNPSSEFTDILDRHNNVSISEIYNEKMESEVEVMQLSHKKDGKKSKAESAFDEALQTFEKKKQSDADNALKLEDYPVALKLYSELLTNAPDNLDNNYKFGVCVFNAERDKTIAIDFFKKAATSSKTPADVYYYIAQIFHLNKQYDYAIANYTKFSKLSSPSEIKKLQIDRKIENCINGKNLVNKVPRYEIINQKMVASEGIHQAFNTHDFNGKILLTPDDFRSDYDKKINFKSTMFLTHDNTEIYYSSYGTDGKNGKDIYKRTKLSTGDWGQPQYQEGINTPYDEDFPFLTQTGPLYFSSQGFTSMGGYDIFTSLWNGSTQSWSTPENMAAPANSPADDIFFIPCIDGQTSYFSSDRNTLAGQMEIFNAKILKK